LKRITLEHFSSYHMYHISLLFRNSRKESVDSTRKDNFIIHNSYKNMTTIRWNRFIWIQSNPCFPVLHRKSKAKKIH